MPTQRFPISFDRWYGTLSAMLGLPPSGAYVEVSGDQVEVRMGWAFRTHFPRSAIASVLHPDVRPISRGVHGFAGRWLVNGSATGIVAVSLDPPQRGYVAGIPVRLRELLVSVEDPAAAETAFEGRNPFGTPRGAELSGEA